MVQAEVVEGQILELLNHIQLSDELADLVFDRVKRKMEATRPAPTAARSAAEIRSQLDRLADLYEMGDISAEKYRARKQSLRDELDKMVRGAEQPAEWDESLARAILQQFTTDWNGVKPHELRAIVAAMFHRIIIADKAVVAVEPRKDVFPLFVAAGQATGVVEWVSDGLQAHIAQHTMRVLAMAA